MATVKYLDENGLSTVWSKVKGIVTPKADKVSGATAGHLAGLNSGGNLTDSGLPATNIAQKDGSYSGMTVGAAEDLVSAESVASEFTSRITGGSTAVGKGGTALVDKIKGRTLVWNQLVQNGNFASSTNNWAAGVTATSISVSNGVLRVSVISGTNISNMCASQDINTITDHKYLIRYKLKNHTNTGNYYVGYLSAPTQWIGSISLPNQDTETTASFILTANNNRTRIMFGLYRGSSADTSYFEAGDYVDYSNITCIDLTLMFGAGNEPSTVAEFEALYPGPYYDYNPGTLISNAATAIETVGWNAFDESTFILGKYRQPGGEEQQTAATADRRCSDVFYPCYPNTSYYVYSSVSNTYTAVVCWYDETKTYISGNALANSLVTSPSNAKFFRVSTASPNNKVCISLSDPSRNGTYEPYWRSELDLNIPTLTGKLNGTGNSVVIFPDGLRSAGTVYDEIVGNKAIKRIGKRSYASGDNEDVTLITDGTNTYYPLATPEEYILDEAIPTAMRNDPYGTERRLPEDTAAIVTAPFRADITYSTNIKEAVQSLPQNYINVNSMQDFLAALGTLMGGTWTMRPIDGKFDFTFTPNPSNE